MTPPQLRKGRPQARYSYFAPAAAGLEPVLLAEAQALGLEDCRQEPGGISFAGGLDACYRANLWLRTAGRVLRILTRFDCWDEATLYREVYRQDWHKVMDLEQTLAVRVSLGRSPMTHSQFLSRRIKDAVVDRFRDLFGKRPSVDAYHPHIQIHAYLHDGQCTLSLDSSGPPLFMRGYRQGNAAAPLKETLAAGLIGLTGWSGERPFYDFMCGSGTLPIEAALLAGRRAPGLLRERFGFEHWPDHQAALWRKLKDQARLEARPVPVSILASDRDRELVALAKENAARAGVADAIRFSAMEAADFQPSAGPGLVLVNPPYGERLGDRKRLASLYKQLGDVLKHRAKGSDAYIFTAQGDLIKSIGLRPKRRLKLFNGALECRLLHYPMY